MSITLQDVAALQREKLSTTTRKIIYLTIRELSQQTGWAEISLFDLCEQTGLTTSGLIKSLRSMQQVGLVEKKREKTHRYAKNQYRVIEA